MRGPDVNHVKLNTKYNQMNALSPTATDGSQSATPPSANGWGVPRTKSPVNGYYEDERDAYDPRYARDTYDRISRIDQEAGDASTARIAQSMGGRFQLTPLTVRAIARAGLIAIVFIPLLLMPAHGFMLGNGLDDVLLASYSLLGASFMLVVALHYASPDPNPEPQILPFAMRAAYAASWAAAPVLSRSVDWSAYLALPLGVVGLMVVRRPCSLWFIDVYVLSMLLAPSASITLAYTLDLQDTIVVSNISISQWQEHPEAHAGAFAFTDGYVVTQWRGRMTEWSRQTGGTSKALRSAYGVAPVVPSPACIRNSTEFRGEYMSACEVSMVVMYSPKWESLDDGYNDIDDGALGASVNTRHGSCSISGHVGRKAKIAGLDHEGIAVGGGLCVYADPLYRAPRGTPVRAIEECRMLMRRHALQPLSICDTQFFLVDHDEDTRRHQIVQMAILSCTVVVAGVIVGLWFTQVTMRLRRLCFMCTDELKRNADQIDMI